MNENKMSLVRLIVNQLTDSQCENILDALNRKGIEVAARDPQGGGWDENLHPRAQDGRFTSGPHQAPLTKSEQQKIERTGKNPVFPKDVRKKLADKQRILKVWEEQAELSKGVPGLAENASKRLMQTKSEIADIIRDYKTSRRKEIEGGAIKRHMKKLATEAMQIEDDLDYLQEVYADRGGDLTALVWPKTRKGKRDKAKYEALLKRREELQSEIDWDLVEEDE